MGLAGLAGLGGPAVAALGLALAAALVLAAAPLWGALALVFMAQTDGLTGHLDRVLPLSAFKLLSAATLALALLGLSRNPLAQGRPRPAIPFAATGLFAGWLVVAHLLGPGGATGDDHLEGFLTTLLMVPILGLLIRRPGELRLAIGALVASGAVSALCVLLETTTGLRLAIADPTDIAAWGGQVRPAGASAYNPTTASHLVLVSLLAGAGMGVGDRPLRWVWWGMAGLCLAGLPMMGARSAIVGLAAGGLVALWQMRRHRAFPVIVAALVAGAVLALPLLPDSLTERFAVLGDLFDGGNTADRTLLRRLSYNLIGLDLWARNPVAGIGPGLFPESYAGPDFRWYPGREAEPRQLHNTFLEVAVETGTVGLALFLAATIGACRMALRVPAHGPEGTMARALGTAFAAFLAASLFMPNEDIKHTWILVALCARAGRLAEARP